MKRLGFTLIELVVVIALLGILAIIAVPRFISVTTEARIGMLNGLNQNIKSAVALAQIKYKAAGNTSATTVDMDGTSVTVVAGSGIPVAATGGIDTAVNYSAGANSGLTANLGVATAGSAVFYYAGTATSPTCGLTYVQSTGAVTVVTTSC